MAPETLVTDAQLASIGERLRRVRERSGYTLDEVASLTGLSKAHLSRLESADRQPSIAALLTFAKAMSVSVGWLLGEDESDLPIAIHLGDDPRRDVAGLQVSPMSGYSGSSMLEALRMTIAVDRVPGPPASHRGEEWLYVVKGTLRLEYDGAEHRLPKGASVHFDAERPHRLGAIGQTTEVLIVVADASRSLPAIHR
ncbi:MAG: XRE family transcriptional regulator [Acidimicrobiales bacterium]|jgi:transcriptional regulator with XRE-family HTH domain